MLREKARVLESEDIERILRRMAHEVVENNRGLEGLVLVGIQRRGVYLAWRLRDRISQFEDVRVPCGELDITLYRDDLTLLHDQPVVHSTSIPGDLRGKHLVLVDDVIYTGRTVRSAQDALMDLGRPATVRLGVLSDRGHRELPIQPDFAVSRITLAPTQSLELARDAAGGFSFHVEGR